MPATVHPRRIGRLVACLSALVATATATAATAPGTWDTGTPIATGLSLVLTDGSILQQPSFDTASWQRIAPDATGHYDFAHPQARAAMHHARGFFPSVVLRDGRVFVAGGEYGDGAQDRTCEVYDPVADAWTEVDNHFGVNFSDCTAVALPDGRVLALPNGPVTGVIWDPVANSWTRTSTNGFAFNESTATQLPGGVFLVNNPNGYPTTVKYLSATDEWVAAADAPTGAGAISSGGEIGSRVLLYDGRALAFGNVGPTAFYVPGSDPHGTGSWQAGPTVPDGTKMQDQMAVVMPNGHVLVAGDRGGHTAPTYLYDYDPVANGFTNVTPSAGALASTWADPFMALLLPSGQVIVAGLGIYTPTAGGPSDAWRPTIAAVGDLGSGRYRITGTRLNGLTDGTYYGDDAQMATNWPLVRLTASGGAVTFARTANFSTMALGTGTATVTADFTLPSLGDGAYALQAVTNGIASAAITVQISGGHLSVGGGTTTGGTTTSGTTTAGTSTGGTTTGGTTTSGTTTAGTTTSGTTTAGTTTSGTTTASTTTGGTSTAGTTTAGTTTAGTTTGGTSTSGTTTSGTTTGGTTTASGTTAGTTTGGASGSSHHKGCGAGAGFAVAVGLLLALGLRRRE